MACGGTSSWTCNILNYSPFGLTQPFPKHQIVLCQAYIKSMVFAVVTMNSIRKRSYKTKVKCVMCKKQLSVITKKIILKEYM